MTVDRLEREMSGREVMEWAAFFRLVEEEQRDNDPENMSPSERRAYLAGAATTEGR